MGGRGTPAPRPVAGDLLLGVDLGTMGTKAGVFDLHGTMVAEAYIESTLLYPRPGWVEQRQEDIYEDAMTAIRRCVRASGTDPARIAAIAFVGQMAGIGTIDAEWRPVVNFDSWLDLRCGRDVEAIDRLHGDAVTTIDGCPPMANHAPRILRLMREEPRKFERVAAFVVPSTYVAGRMAGLSAGDAFIDHTFLHFSGVADAINGTWSPELCERLGIPIEKLPMIVEPWALVGKVIREAAEVSGLREGTLIAAGAGDQAAGALGAGIVDPGVIFDGAGTAAVFAACVDQYQPDVANRTLVVSRSVLPGLWMPLSYVAGGGLCLRWFRDTFAADVAADAASRVTSPYALLDDMAESIPPGSDLLWFIPHLGGRTLPSQPALRGTWSGFSWSHTRAHFYRAILESVAYEYLRYYEIIRELHPEVTFTEAVVIGGGARSRLWNQIKADVLGVRYVALNRSELATWGAAMIAGRAAGLIDDLAATARKRASRVGGIDADPSRREAYDRMAAQYRLLVGSMEPVFDAAGSMSL